MSYIDPDQLHGELDNLVTFVGDNTATLTAKGLNAETIQARLKAVADDLTGKKTVRDTRKTELAKAQQAFAASAATNYAAFSDIVDTVAGTLGKQSPEGKQVLGYRKHVTGADNHSSSTHTPAPAPTPPAA